MDHRDFYHEKKWCAVCDDYVRYLMSVNRSYCIQCSSPVKMFSSKDTERFNENVEKRKWKVS